MTDAVRTGGMFRSLRIHDYRVWSAGAIVSNVGTWMQRTAQDWIVLTQLTHGDAFAVGVTMALQFGPQLLLLPITGLAADRIPKRTLLMLTQAVMGLLALGLGLLSIAGVVTLPEVFGFAFLLGCAAAFDAPARQSFVSELVGPDDVTNAVALNSASFNAARLLGPAVAGLLTEAVGPGWVFLLNAASFAAVIVSLRAIHPAALEPAAGGGGRSMGDFVAGFRYVRFRRDLMVVFTMIFLMGTFGMNFPIYASTMAVLLHQGASGYGLLSTALAIGAVAGALLAARRAEPRFGLLIVAGLLFGVGLVLGALAPNYLVLAFVLPLVGLAAQTFMTTANGAVQLSVERWVRGRVMAIYMAIFMGGTVIGAPVIGWIANAFGPRYGLVAGGSAGLLAAIVGAVWLSRARSAKPAEDPSVLAPHAVRD
ncbi:MFS transporter [Amnibacterium sp. CER49]|uniref:MFS transporter n=1 Tax=Amnibacterium sp. CER49 TaxID=3039161 RepID=UPI00244A99E1|nr:MFS transporter [Amnibacterium sp. CER49]MDH2443534.1 MFS transporter [Amnibacterium sp. CER49]